MCVLDLEVDWPPLASQEALESKIHRGESAGIKSENRNGRQEEKRQKGVTKKEGVSGKWNGRRMVCEREIRSLTVKPVTVA